MKHYQSVERLSIFRMSSPPSQTERPPIKKVLAMVLSLQLIRLLSTRSVDTILPKWNKSLNTYVRSVMASPNLWVGQNAWF